MNAGSGAAEPRGSLDVALAHAVRLLERDPALAVKQAGEILSTVPGHPGASLVLGIGRRNSGDPAAALTVLAPLAVAQPHCAAAHFELGVTLGALARGEDAVAELRTAVALNPDLPDAWRALADHLTAMGGEAGAAAAPARFLTASTRDVRLEGGGRA